MSLSDLSANVKAELDGTIGHAGAGIRGAIDFLRPLLTSPLVDNGLRAAVSDLLEELDSLDDRIPEILRLVSEKFGDRKDG